MLMEIERFAKPKKTRAFCVRVCVYVCVCVCVFAHTCITPQYLDRRGSGLGRIILLQSQCTMYIRSQLYLTGLRETGYERVDGSIVERNISTAVWL